MTFPASLRVAIAVACGFLQEFSYILMPGRQESTKRSPANF